MFTYRKNDEMDDLLALGADVLASAPASQRPSMTAREAARALVGVVGWLSKRRGVLEMQETMASLARTAGAWAPERPFCVLPTTTSGLVAEDVALVASVCSGLAPLFGLRVLRSAVAFWATETDPAIWRDVAAA